MRNTDSFVLERLWAAVAGGTSSEVCGDFFDFGFDDLDFGFGFSSFNFSLFIFSGLTFSGFDFEGVGLEGLGLDDGGLEEEDFAVVGRVVGLAVAGRDEDDLPVTLDLSRVGFANAAFRGDGNPEEGFDDGC